MQENHRRHGFDPCIRNIPWRRAWQPIPIFLTGEFHGQRSLVGSSPQGHKESDTTKASKHSTSTTSLAVQWLRLCFHCSRHGFDPWVGNEPTSRSTVQPRKKKKKERNRASYLPSLVHRLGQLGKVHVEVPSFTLLLKNIPAGRKLAMEKTFSRLKVWFC